METLLFQSDSESDTDRFGAALARLLPDGAVVALEGTLGAGKTRLVRAVAVACDVSAEEVVSPTFVLCQRYHGRRTIVHLDAYRMRDADEFWQLGVDESFGEQVLVFIEWAERVAECLPAAHLRLEIEVTGITSRQLRLSSNEDSMDDVVRRVRQALDASSM